MNEEHLICSTISALGIRRQVSDLPQIVAYAEHSSAKIREHVMRALGWLRHLDTIIHLKRGLADPQPSVRHAALAGLIINPEYTDGSRLRDLMISDPNALIRAKAARGIGFRKFEAFQPLKAALAHESDERVLTQLVYAIHRLGYREFTPALILLEKSSHWPLKIEVLRATSTMGGMETHHVKALQSPNPLVRIEAIRGVARMDPTKLRPHYVHLTSDRNPGVRVALCVALAHPRLHDLAKSYVNGPADHHPEVRRQQNALKTLLASDSKDEARPAKRPSPQ